MKEKEAKIWFIYSNNHKKIKEIIFTFLLVIKTILIANKYSKYLLYLSLSIKIANSFLNTCKKK